MFAAALGYRRFDHARLIKQIKQGILGHEAVPIDLTPYGARFASKFPLLVPPGSAIVRTLWIVRTGEDVPRLTSAYPIR